MAELILEVVEGVELGRKLELDGPLDIGRDAAMTVALAGDMYASPRHARVTPRDGGAVVEDLGSANGTFVNDQPIRAPRPLRPGDRVRVGLTVLELRSRRQVQERPSAVRPRPRLADVGDQALPPQPAPPLPGAPRATPVFEPGVGFRAAQTPAGYVPAEVIAGEEPERDAYGGLTRMMDAPVKRQRNEAAFVLLGSSALAVLLYFGLT